jgi:hypothetical protein
MPGWIRNLMAVLDRLKTERPGAFTEAEAAALGYLGSQLAGLTHAQYESVLKSASIHLLLVEEMDLQHSREAVRLLDDVVGRPLSAQAWRDLVALAGRTARLRGGFTLAGWLDLLMQEGHQVLSEGSTAAAHLARQQAARERYNSQLKLRGGYVDLRPLGASLPPLPVGNLDARIRVVVPTASDRDQRDLLWAFLRRGRMLLTGLPGGGKSMAILMTAACLLDVPDGPVPVVASLRDIDRRDRSASFHDRLLDVAVRDLSATDRALVRAELEGLLENGGVALFLDSLDETHDRRGHVVSELHRFLSTVSEDVDVLVATRDVAYAQAATLGWPDMRLSPPEEIGRSVRAVLEASATATSQADREDWVHTRVGWVDAVLARDETLTETPLLPILLALLASEKSSDALPRHRAAILHAVVRNVVERREARRDEEFRVGELVGEMAASATLDGFAAEAGEIAARGGQCSLVQAIRVVADMLATRWELRAGRAEVTADAIVRFWDEAGILIVSGAAETVAPRVELYAEIGEAIRVTQGPAEEVVQWVDATARAGRYESIVLAAGLSEAAARQLLVIAATADNRQLLLAALTAVREGAIVGEPELRGLVNGLADDARVGDPEAWQTWSRLAELRLPDELQSVLLEALASFPPEYQAIGRALVILRGQHQLRTTEDTVQLLDALRVTELPQLPRRERTRRPDWSDIMEDRSFAEAKVGAAAALLGAVEEATALVVDALRHGSFNTQQKLSGLLEQHGLGHLVREALQEEWLSMRESAARLLDYDRNAHTTLLRDLCATPAAALTYQQETRLSELADFCESMRLNDIGAWPRRGESREDFHSLLTTVQQLGRFDAAVLSAQARIVLSRIDAFSSNIPFFALFDQATARDLDNWDQIPDQHAAVELLVRTLFRGLGAALVAASALWEAPVADLAVPLLLNALPRLAPSPRHQRVGAFTLLSLTDGAELGQWVADPNPVLRRISAEKIQIEQAGTLTPEILALLQDDDGYVVQSAVERLSGNLTPAKEAELARVSTAPNPGWMCLHCRTHNDQGHTSCRQCSVVGANPSRTAAAILGRREQG